jgi:hypothetical protein
VFCPWRTLSFIYVLEFNSAEEREKLDVESEVFYATQYYTWQKQLFENGAVAVSPGGV